MTSRGGQHCFNGGQYGSGVPSRDCHVASLLAMTNRRCVPFYDGSFRTAVPSRDCHVGLRPPRNDKSGGQHCFNGGQYGSGVPSRDCHVASLLAMTNRRCVPFYDGSFRTAVPSRDCHVGLRPPRNDKSGVHAGLTVARSERQCLPEIATSASGLLAMTNRGASTVLTAASTDRGCLPEIATSLRSSQ